ncbi:MAG: metallophosphoesterase family protein [Bacteroidota bacterium]
MKVSILSDTHGFMDEQVLKHLKTSDEIWHAGDIGSIDVLNILSTLPGQLRIVFGNIDNTAVRTNTTEHLNFEVQGVKIMITHIADKPPKYNKVVREMIAQHKPNILVAGHSHLLKVINDKENQLLFINPGACGQQGFHKMRTIINLEIIDGKPQNMAVVDLGKRGQLKQ